MKLFVASGKRKTAIAKASVKQGKGNVMVNGVPLDQVQPDLTRVKIREPLLLAGDAAQGVSLSVSVVGGGVTAQADAARLAIAKALVGFTKSERLKDRFLKYDRHLLVADVRRKEPSKPNRRGQARSKRQKSYR